MFLTPPESLVYRNWSYLFNVNQSPALAYYINKGVCLHSLTPLELRITSVTFEVGVTQLPTLLLVEIIINIKISSFTLLALVIIFKYSVVRTTGYTFQSKLGASIDKHTFLMNKFTIRTLGSKVMSSILCQSLVASSCKLSSQKSSRSRCSTGF